MKPAAEGSAARLRGLLADLLELVQVRLELLAIEAREDIARLATLALQGVLAAVLLGFGLVFLAVFCTVLLWDSERLLVLGVFTALFLGGGTVLALLVWRGLQRGVRLFRSSVDELRRDQERLRS
ncbi:MAG TPA: phage holin family protein [Ottowia sp.]|uniref:phage holin family protein n=1 Tax=Ottowia sp. TaxID=1898956 RepID=UPI002CEFDEBC|nr:phage holin family protein [Ottowia sp.]HMN20282.1 phage holin family protein [Ottowia sp.]